jgi:cell division topological specificity factor
MALLRRLLGREDRSSSQVAKQRLQLVLVHDRANISPGLLAMIKDDIITVISRHIEIDREAVQINFSQQGRESRLVADIPLSERRPSATRRDQPSTY